ncbi:MAG: tRNA lysidine(34) synthetase TilS [Alphaproteobacteria bacterium]|nr:tRNA lysidine(34) synthetase TilS [Alphaproteobacteria bacterium]
MPKRKSVAAPNRKKRVSPVARRRRPGGARRVSAAQFATAMAAFEPFEDQPHLAVAVSGGADSLALCLLAAEWAATRGGRVTALTVDHGLRRESAGEARQVGRILAGRGIRHVIRRWGGAKPATGIPAAARAARYALLDGWCADHGVLHLLLAHQRDDVAETVALRAGRGSGFDGLAGMSAVIELPTHRRLRPLLTVPAARLRATLRARALGWIDDPTNRDPRFARARLRAGRLDGATWSGWARRMAAIRIHDEIATALLLARSALVDPAGFCRLDLAVLRAAPRPLAARALARALLCVGGGHYPPGRASLARVVDRLFDGAATSVTLSGCRIVATAGFLTVLRETRGAGEIRRLAGVGRHQVQWDGRFELAVRAAGAVTVARLGMANWLARRAKLVVPAALPAAAMAAAPALYRRGRLVIQPDLRRPALALPSAHTSASAVFAPRHMLISGSFAVA